MSPVPRVSLITPTFGRDRCLIAVHQALRAQTVADFEWLILDDSPEPSPYFTAVDDVRVRYHHHSGPRQTIGTKRNRLAEAAAAPVIAHIDDDDYYAPDYLATMLSVIDQGADFAKLSAWFLYSLVYKALGYWDLAAITPLHLVWSPDPMKTIDLAATAKGGGWDHLRYGFGFSYVYRRDVWRAQGFPDQNFDEDAAFIGAARNRGADIRLLADDKGLVLHTLHRGNASICLPQYHLPPFAIDRHFPPDARRFLAAIG